MVKQKMAQLGQSSSQRAQVFARYAFWGQSKFFYQLLGITGAIVVFGLVFLLSSSSIVSIQQYDGDAFAISRRQFFFSLAGFAALTALSVLPPAAMRKLTNAIFIFALGLQAAVLLVGENINGNKAWLKLPLIGTIQPSEFLKLALILKLAQVMHDRAHVSDIAREYTWRTLGYFVVAVGLVALGSDMGTSIVISCIALLMIYLSGAPAAHLRAPLIGVGVLGAIMLLGGPSRIARVTAWLTPGSDSANDYAWQSVHGIWAVAAGGLTGVGLGNSKLKWSWIPEVENDYIFAIIAEEGGMLFAILLLAAFAYLGVTLYRIFQRCEGMFEKLVTLGVLSWIVVQATINIGVVLGLLPVLGVPLPLISQGGSSLIAALAAIGVVLGFERDNHSRLGARVAPKRARR